MNDAELIIKAFPTFLTKDVLSLLSKVSLKDKISHQGSFQVFVKGEKLHIPYRIYFEEPSERNLNEAELLILDCLFTRHHNGFVRERRLRRVLLSVEYWTAPFIMQLLGEYVLEILVVIKENLSDKQIDNLVHFIGENESFFETTKRRIISYWDCYYRYKFPVKNDYAGFQILAKLEDALAKRKEHL